MLLVKLVGGEGGENIYYSVCASPHKTFGKKSHLKYATARMRLFMSKIENPRRCITTIDIKKIYIVISKIPLLSITISIILRSYLSIIII